ncbi:heavy metal translocating P-type ATPase [Arcanobacterium pinnipediorum]|uniref:Heavy metal translocating P-type ATPase n=1 Tax=Arcanobacterium pinnipediorum TaxID=1503041 RepID=A0ABY5AIB7_9ACTO|nr:heavy metal translocating P-type ATPase [Arcanobacterium pinnipediorum]USR79837.1 heavy metal translocating P-type ATPase [Arcanobacterium pinnipediorum]
MLALSIPTTIFSSTFASFIGYELPTSTLITWISPVLATIIYVWGGKPFLSGALSEIRSRRPGMMLLIALAISVAFFASLASTLNLITLHLDFWWELALLIVIMLLGHWIEMRSLAQTSSALESLASLLPDEAELIEGETITVVPVHDLQPGDITLVRPGSAVPADGKILEGTAHVDESMITGESTPVKRSVGETVVAGTVVADSALHLAVSATGENTALAGIQKLVLDAQSSTSRAQLLADRAAQWLFWFALSAALITFIVWSALGNPTSALTRTITVLVIACPHALGLAIPLVVSIATQRAAQAGVLIKDRHALENMRTVDTVFFDKTGTLTQGHPSVTAIHSTIDDDELLALAAAVEYRSEHPLARAIVTAAAERSLDIPDSSEFQMEAGVGVHALVDGRTISVGGPALLAQYNHDELRIAAEWKKEGAIILHVLDEEKVLGAVRLADDVRPESRQAIEELHARGIGVVMMTGDAEAVAHTVAHNLSIDRVFAGVKPDGKAETVRHVQREGRFVAMVGDGVNDAPALAQADVGIAIGAGTDVAISSAGVILASSDPRAVLSILTLSDASYRKMKQNLWWAGGYNLISVPLAAGILAPIGFTMPMSVGALLMSASTVIVALNAQLLRRLKLR